LHVAADEGPAVDVPATEHCTITRDGVLLCDIADGGVGDLRYVSGMVLASFSGSFGLFDRLNRPIAQRIDHSETVKHAYSTMLHELERPQLGARALTSALMKACMVLVLRQFIASEAPHSAMLASLADPRFRKAIDAILDRPAEQHSIKSLSPFAGMSSSAFCRQFGAAFGIAPMQFVAKTRLHHAAQLLRSTPVPVKLIAGMVGYASRSHFSRHFKASYGVGPAEFRTGFAAGAIDPPLHNVAQ
jgi:AraC-like DNA-binding protein